MAGPDQPRRRSLRARAGAIAAYMAIGALLLVGMLWYAQSAVVRHFIETIR
jgi:hypothetical protein